MCMVRTQDCFEANVNRTEISRLEVYMRCGQVGMKQAGGRFPEYELRRAGSRSTRYRGIAR